MRENMNTERKILGKKNMQCAHKDVYINERFQENILMQVCISNFNFNRVLNYAIWIQFPRPTMVREDRKPSYYEIHLGSKIVIVHRKRHQDGARRIIYGRSKHLINFPIGNGKDRKKKKRWVHFQLHGGIYIYSASRR